MTRGHSRARSAAWRWDRGRGGRVRAPGRIAQDGAGPGVGVCGPDRRQAGRHLDRVARCEPGFSQGQSSAQPVEPAPFPGQISVVPAQNRRLPAGDHGCGARTPVAGHRRAVLRRDGAVIFQEGAMLRKALMRFRTAELTGRYPAPRWTNCWMMFHYSWFQRVFLRILEVVNF